jgi:hypothetical protein
MNVRSLLGGPGPENTSRTTRHRQVQIEPVLTHRFGLATHNHQIRSNRHVATPLKSETNHVATGGAP